MREGNYRQTKDCPFLQNSYKELGEKEHAIVSGISEIAEKQAACTSIQPSCFFFVKADYNLLNRWNQQQLFSG